MKTVNLGILAHVDAGKTSLTERLLYATGVIDAPGRVDDGSTQTDSLPLEQQRGITIKAAVVSFTIGDVTVNTIDTPGHPDFIAEVERALLVLDGAVLVVSAVEGVQAQTRVLMRTLRRLQIPTLFFINKVDRRGADPERVIQELREKLAPSVIAMGTVDAPGQREAEVRAFGAGDAAFVDRLAEHLAERDDTLLAAYLDDDGPIPYARLHRALVEQTAKALVYPAYVGSAITGAGIDALLDGIATLLPAAEGDAAAPLSGTVFKIERGPSGEKVVYARIFAGTLRTRDRLAVSENSGHDTDRKVTALHVFERGGAVQRGAAVAGQIAQLWGLTGVRIGDTFGAPRRPIARQVFAPPTLESVIVPRHPADKGRLHAALAQLADRDPLINLQQDDARGDLSVSLYGEVQKEVIQATLAAEFDIETELRDTTVICIERPVGTGTAVEWLRAASNPFLATVGLRVEPAPIDSGVSFRVEAELTTLPLYVYKSVDELRQTLAETVRATLRQGLCGWRVTDCTVTLTHSGYIPPATTAGDFRKLLPLVLIEALAAAGTTVCEPMHHVQLDVPIDTFGPVASALAQLGATLRTQETRGTVSLLDGLIPAARVHELQQRLPGLTHGEGVLESTFEAYQPVSGTPPTRPHSGRNPRNRKEYLAQLAGRT